MEREVLRYMRSHGNPVWPDDIAEELGVTVLEVLETLASLQERGKVREVRTEEA